MALSKKVRELLEETFISQAKDSMFGDGMEDDYLRDGFPSYTPPSKMGDDELIDEVESTCFAGEGDLKRRTHAGKVKTGDWVKLELGWFEVGDVASGPDQVTLVVTVAEDDGRGEYSEKLVVETVADAWVEVLNVDAVEVA